jgi:hypothetical protein
VTRHALVDGARGFATRHDLRTPDVGALLCAWADNLVAGRSASR